LPLDVMGNLGQGACEIRRNDAVGAAASIDQAFKPA
jgi:hypothetical protein